MIHPSTGSQKCQLPMARLIPRSKEFEDSKDFEDSAAMARNYDPAVLAQLPEDIREELRLNMPAEFELASDYQVPKLLLLAC